MNEPRGVLETRRRLCTTNLLERLAVSSQRNLTAHRKQCVCKFCGSEFITPITNPGIYCSRKCKGDWQRTQKPVDRDWLYEKYIVEGLDCTAISKIVGRNSKRVWEWLRDYGIPTRPRGSYYASQPHFSFWLHGGPSPMLGRKMSPEYCAKMSAIAKADGRVPFDPKIGPPLKGKRGAGVHTWKGGVTPERASLYSSAEWKEAVRGVWKRDNATCQRCGIRKNDHRDEPFDIHHIVSFACRELRAELSNLVLLCEKCHYWVHSTENTEREFIRDME
jgi:hypothetical protein